MTNTAVVVLGVCFLSACAASGSAPGGASGTSGGSGGSAALGGSGGVSGVGGVGGVGGGNALTAHVETPEGLEIEIVTIACEDQCAEVIAVAHGGNPDYTFAWSDGATTAARRLCPDDDTTYRVTVTDTAIIDTEFPYAAQTARANVTANVIACADAGVDAGQDAEVSDAGAVGECSGDLEQDPTCDLIAPGSACAGLVTYDLPHPIEAGQGGCVALQAQPSLSLLAEIRAGTGCTLNTVGATSPLNFSGPWGWQVCWPPTTRIERIGITGLAASAITSFRHCPNCGR